MQQPNRQRLLEHRVPPVPPDAFAPLSNRLSALLLDETTRRTFAQRENRVDIARMIDDGTILIIAPPASIEAASIVVGMLIAETTNAAFRRAGTPAAKHHCHFFIDECHRFLTSSTTLQRILDETSKCGLSVTLANQESTQISNELLNAMHTMPNIYVFGVSMPDAKALAPLFNGLVRADVLANQGTGAVTARINGDLTTFQCPPPPTTNNDALRRRIIAHSTATYHAAPTKAAPANHPGSARRVIRTID